MLLILLACNGGGGGHTHDTADPCADVPEFEEGATGTSSATGSEVRLAVADPSPPDVGINTWTLEVSLQGQPAPGLEVVVTPWMPLHGHGLVPADYLGADQGDGTYVVEPFDVIMPGEWEFTVDLDPGGAVEDTVLFRFCAEG